MKPIVLSAILGVSLICLGANAYAVESKPVVAKGCEIEHFIGTGETLDLSFSVCKDALASHTFRENFSMDCQHGLVTYHMKLRPTAKYLRLGNDGNPVHCSST